MIGQTVSHYKITRKLGSGGMGNVYLAKDVKLNRLVALKFLPPGLIENSDALERFRREARSAAALNHPNIVTVYDIGEYKGTPYIAMEYVDGRALGEYSSDGPRPISEDLIIVLGLTRGLQKAHEAGIIHRDLKPSNVILDSDGQPRIVDFGIAKAFEGEDVTGTGITVGTLAYMAPEQIEGLRVDYRCDIWSVGVLLYELVAGQRPFKGVRAAALSYAILRMTPVPMRELRSEVPEALERIVGKCLAKNPGSRYQSAADLESDLLMLPEAATLSRAPALSDISPGRRRWIPIYLAIPAMLLVIGLLSYWMISRVMPEVSQTRTPEIAALAILPIRNLGPVEHDYLANGLTDDLIAKASKVSHLRVISRLSMMQFRDTGISPREIAERLNASAILDGGIRWADNQFYITVTLMQPEEDIVVWAETYTGKVRDLFGIQEDMVRMITSKLGVDLGPTESIHIAQMPTQSAEAYSRHQKAREYYYRYTRDDNENAISLFQAALREDSLYADALAGLADAYSQRSLRHGFSKEWHDSAITVCLRALQIDSTNPAVHKARGLAYLGKGFYRQSLEANKKALRFSPNHYPAATNAGMISLLVGDLEQALRFHIKAAALAPTQGMPAAYVANDYALLGMDECAGYWFDRALEIQPDLSAAIALRAYWHLARSDGRTALQDCHKALAEDTAFLTLKLAGDAALLSDSIDLARGFYERAVASVSHFGVQAWIPLAFIMIQEGKTDSAQVILDRCFRQDLASIEAGNESCEPRHRIAAIYLIRGQVNDAMAWYQAAVDHGWRNHRLDAFNPLFRSVQGHPEFQQIAQDVARTLDSATVNLTDAECRQSS